jgi:hypothetical protein
MRGMERWLNYCARNAGVALAALCMVFTLAPNLPGQGGRQAGGQAGNVPPGWFDPGLNMRLLPPGGPAPRMADGHPNLTGRYYPNGVGRMVGSYTPGEVESAALRLGDRSKQENPVFKPETKSKYQYPTPYGTCAPGGTPTSLTTQSSEHGPTELIQQPDGVMWILTEFPISIRRITTDGTPHPADPDASFAGDSRGHWEGDTLVVHTIAIDTRMRNISVGLGGDANAWTHSDQEIVIERFSRPSKNFLSYQITVVDPVVLEKPFTSTLMRWSLAQDPNDVWTEYLCTANEDAEAWKNVDPAHRQAYEEGRIPGPGPRQ